MNSGWNGWRTLSGKNFKNYGFGYCFLIDNFQCSGKIVIRKEFGLTLHHHQQYCYITLLLMLDFVLPKVYFDGLPTLLEARVSYEGLCVCVLVDVYIFHYTSKALRPLCTGAGLIQDTGWK